VVEAISLDYTSEKRSALPRKASVVRANYYFRSQSPKSMGCQGEKWPEGRPKDPTGALIYCAAPSNVNPQPDMGCAPPGLPLEEGLEPGRGKILPVLLKLPISVQCSKIENRLRSWIRPSHPGLLQTLLGNVSTG